MVKIMAPSSTHHRAFGHCRHRHCGFLRDDFRAVFGPSHTNLIFDVDLPFNYHTEDAAFAKALTAEIKKLDPRFNAVITVDRTYLRASFEDPGNENEPSNP